MSKKLFIATISSMLLLFTAGCSSSKNQYINMGNMDHSKMKMDDSGKKYGVF